MVYTGGGGGGGGGELDMAKGARYIIKVAIGLAGGLGYIRARAGSRCARISGTYT